MFSVAFGIFQFLLPFVGIQGHLPTDVRRRGMVLQAVKGKGVLAFIEGSGDRAHQPVLQHADTANAALVEIHPIGADERFRIAAQRHFFQERQQRGLELKTILFPLQEIPRKMDRQAAPGELPI